MTIEFGDLLRRLRLAAKLSQEALAELAGLSSAAISAYERGIRSTPHFETLARLANALQLSGEAYAQFEAAADSKRSPVSLGHAPNSNLPWQPTSFIGRQREVEDISTMLAPRHVVTLSGSGGIGKTRTALEVASHLAHVPSDGVWFVDLAPLTDVSLVVSKIASSLDLQLPPQGDTLGALTKAIKGREFLLILDNCEHVLAMVRTLVEAILQACPRITLLATSRERLGIAGELAYPLSTLEMKDALQLFTERAAAADHQFALDDEHVEAATDICRRLDGIALAIELAAARLPVLGLSELRLQLTKHFTVIANGRHDLPARQKTLYAAISWSYELLGERERILFRRLAVFANGWSLEAAESVCASDALERESVVDTLCSLVDKSLVLVDVSGAMPRYSFFESTRMFARECIDTETEWQQLARRHAQWIGTFADRALDARREAPLARWHRVQPELHNALAALEWALGSKGDAVLGGRIAYGLFGAGRMSGLPNDAFYIRAALAQIDAQDHPVLVARLTLSHSRYLNGAAKLEAVERAIAMLEPENDRRTLATGYTLLTIALALMGKYLDAERAVQRAMVICHEERLQRTSLYVGILCQAGSMVYRTQGRLDEARRTLAEALAIAVALDDGQVSPCQSILGDIEFSAGNDRLAVQLAIEALASTGHVRIYQHEFYTRSNLACYQLALGDVDAAEANAREALVLARRINENAVLPVQHLATTAALRGNTSRGARLLGYADAWYERTGIKRDPTDQRGYAILSESLRAQMPERDILMLAAQGAELSDDAAIGEALDT